MKKRWMIHTMLIVLVLSLAACGCKHEWQAANCTTPKTCPLCNTTEGEALGHTWQEATCETAKTCSTCNLTEGEALDHDWQEATTDAPKTCNRCQLTEGERIITDARFTTASTQHLHGVWNCELNLSAEMMGLPMGFENGLDCVMTMEFSNAGEMTTKMSLKDEKAFMDDYRELILQITYATLEDEGVKKEDADKAMQEIYGLSLTDYVETILQNLDMNTLFDAFNAREVYYVDGNKIYTALSWNSTLFEDSAYTLSDGILTIDVLTLEEGGAPMQWKKAE